jgi:2-polyprenyl-6-hydroxyphenyl methylase/3-demethylubiquinone-9 3-methyltransferase
MPELGTQVSDSANSASAAATPSGTIPTTPAGQHHEAEVARGERFRFGANWQRFLAVLDDSRIAIAEESLRDMLGIVSLDGKRFLDAGSGSGLFSLAARRLGATVVSFDFDPQSVACTMELRSRFFPNDTRWTVSEGSILNAQFLESLGSFDVVYSWGVLHHTGDMWRAMELVHPLVAKGGQLFIALYNDQGVHSRVWRALKRTYCSGAVGRWLVTGLCVPHFVGRQLLSDAVRGRNPFEYYRSYRQLRGMSVIRDWHDWLGGYPYEVATPTATFDFFRARGFVLARMKTTNGLGCNEFVFLRTEGTVT